MNKKTYQKPVIEMERLVTTSCLLIASKEYYRPGGDPTNVPNDPAKANTLGMSDNPWLDEEDNDNNKPYTWGNLWE